VSFASWLGMKRRNSFREAWRALESLRGPSERLAEIWLVVQMLLDSIHAADSDSLLHNAPRHHKVKSPVFIGLHNRGELLYIIVWAVLVGKSKSQLR